APDLPGAARAPPVPAAREGGVRRRQRGKPGLREGLAPGRGPAESALSELAVPAQALAAEARLLAQPVSIETGSATHHGGIEDRITLAPLAARRLAEQVELGERLAAVGFVGSAQALHLRGPPRLRGGAD